MMLSMWMLPGNWMQLRSIKTAFEIEENYNMGRIMKDAFDAFSDVARPGVRVWDAARTLRRGLEG